MSIVLRSYQESAVADLRGSLATCKAPLLVLPTGGGKTVVFCFVAQAMAARKKRVFILVHRVELLRQTSEALTKFGVRHGIVHPSGTPDPLAYVQVCSVQTLGRRLKNWPFAPDAIIVDEAHHATAGTWVKILQHWPAAKVIGVTATPVRSDGQGLGIEAGGIFDKLIIGPSVAELIELGFLVNPAVYAPANDIDLAGVKKVRGDFDAKQAAEKVDKRSVTGDAVAHYEKLSGGAPGVAFCISVEHAEHVAAEFTEAGFRAFAVSANTEESRRRDILAGLGNGSVDIVTSCDVISEGTDIPAIGCAILLRPTQSLGLYLQQVGRALRVCAGKERAVILDHVGNVVRHGMPDDDRLWTLDGAGKKGKGETDNRPKFMSCPECFGIHRPAPVCTQCGHVYVLRPADFAKYEGIPGFLKEIGQTEREKLAAAKAAEIDNCKSLDALKKLALRKGWSEGWAIHTFNARAGVTRGLQFN